MSMKFQELVEAHLNWRNSLADLITGGVTPTIINDVHCDDLCEIGQWFQGEGMKRFSDVAEFHAAKDAHMQFHHAAALSLSENGEIGAYSDLHTLIKTFNALNDKIGHLK
jgi:hypothetical protein